MYFHTVYHLSKFVSASYSNIICSIEAIHIKGKTVTLNAILYLVVLKPYKSKDVLKSLTIQLPPHRTITRKISPATHILCYCPAGST